MNHLKYARLWVKPVSLSSRCECSTLDWSYKTGIDAKKLGEVIMLTVEQTKEIINDYKTSENDTGSANVQIALLTARITYLTEHFKSHKKDLHSRRGLIKLVNQRRKLQKYLKGKDAKGYQELIKRLGLRR